MSGAGRAGLRPSGYARASLGWKARDPETGARPGDVNRPVSLVGRPSAFRAREARTPHGCKGQAIANSPLTAVLLALLVSAISPAGSIVAVMT